MRRSLMSMGIPWTMRNHAVFTAYLSRTRGCTLTDDRAHSDDDDEFAGAVRDAVITL